MADEKDVVVEYLKSKSSSKSKFYFKDFTDLFPEKGPREVKKILTKLVNEEVLEFWSSGSTTMYGLKGAGIESNRKMLAEMAVNDAAAFTQLTEIAKKA